MLEDHRGIGVTHFKGESGCITEMSDVVGCIGMPQSVRRPRWQTGFFPGQKRQLAQIGRRTGARFLCNRSKPRSEIWQYLDQTPPSGFGFDFNQTTFKVDFAPIQALDFSCTQSGERSDGQGGNDFGGSDGEQLLEFVDR